MDFSDDLVVENAVAELPDLSLWSIEEYDRGVCEDTSENRKIIRENKARWQPVYTQNGSETKLIQVITTEMYASRNRDKAILLQDIRDKNSAYIQGTALLIEPQADWLVPAWVLAATRRWEDVEDRRRTEPDANPALASAPGRCRAKKMNGDRCLNWHDGRAAVDGLCKMHLATHTRDDDFEISTLTKARNRVQAASLQMADVLEELATTATSEAVRLGAANSLMDRAGIRGGMDINTNVEVTVVPAADIVRDRLLKLAGAGGTQNELEASRIERDARGPEAEVPQFPADGIWDAEVVDD